MYVDPKIHVPKLGFEEQQLKLAISGAQACFRLPAEREPSLKQYLFGHHQVPFTTSYLNAKRNSEKMQVLENDFRINKHVDF